MDIDAAASRELRLGGRRIAVFVGGSIVASRQATIDGSRGRNGGRAVREKYGVEFFREIGSKGGNSLKERGADYVQLGRLGGEVTKARHGSEHYSEIGRKGGRNGRGASKKGSGRRRVS